MVLRLCGSKIVSEGTNGAGIEVMVEEAGMEVVAEFIDADGALEKCVAGSGYCMNSWMLVSFEMTWVCYGWN